MPDDRNNDKLGWTQSERRRVPRRTASPQRVLVNPQPRSPVTVPVLIRMIPMMCISIVIRKTSQMNGKRISMIGRMLMSTGRRAGRLRNETKRLRNVTICVDMSKLLLYNKTTIQVDKRL